MRKLGLGFCIPQKNSMADALCIKGQRFASLLHTEKRRSGGKKKQKTKLQETQNEFITKEPN